MSGIMRVCKDFTGIRVYCWRARDRNRGRRILQQLRLCFCPAIISLENISLRLSLKITLLKIVWFQCIMHSTVHPTTIGNPTVDYPTVHCHMGCLLSHWRMCCISLFHGCTTSPLQRYFAELAGFCVSFSSSSSRIGLGSRHVVHENNVRL